MAKFKIKELEKWETFETCDGEAVALKVRPLGRTDRMHVAALTAKGRPDDLSEFLRGRCVVGWRGFEEEVNGKTQAIEFDQAALDTILGLDDDLAEQVEERLAVLAGLILESKSKDPDPTTEPSLQHTSTADGSAASPASPSSS